MAKQTYTSGNWVVKEGQEDEFIKRWQQFIDQSAKPAAGSGDFYLIQEDANPHHFVSFGTWDSLEAVNGWRGTPEFAELLAKCRELCDDFTPGDYTLRAGS